MLRRLAAVLFPVFCAGHLGAQSAADLADALRQRLAHGPVILRDFSAARSPRAALHDRTVLFSPTSVHCFCSLAITDTTSTINSVTLTGTKQYLLRVSPTQLSPLALSEPVQITLNLETPLAPEVIPSVVDQLFFPTLASALAAFPPELRDVVPGRAASFTPFSVRGKTCDCSEIGTTACYAVSHPGGFSSVSILRQAHLAEPRGLVSKGRLAVSSALLVSPAGAVVELWLLHASSAEAGAFTAKSLLQMSFVPAACHGKAIATAVVINNEYAAP